MLFDWYQKTSTSPTLSKVITITTTISIENKKVKIEKIKSGNCDIVRHKVFLKQRSKLLKR